MLKFTVVTSVLLVNFKFIEKVCLLALFSWLQCNLVKATERISMNLQASWNFASKVLSKFLLI